MVNPSYGSAALACPEKSGQDRPVNDSVVPSSCHSAVSPSGHLGRFHPNGVPRDAIPRLAPRGAHCGAPPVGRALGHGLARGFRFGRNVALVTFLAGFGERWAVGLLGRVAGNESTTRDSGGATAPS